jgi:hypothetical protein
VPRPFREFIEPKGRQRWPLEFDLLGIERNSQVRKEYKQQQEIFMPQQPSNNRFVSGATVDINKPPREPYNPNDPKNHYPKMLYHPTKKNEAEEKEFKRVTLYNSLHPEKPELLPSVGPKFILVHSKQEEQKRLDEGYQSRPPAIPPQSEEEAEADGETLCSRGCGQPPHRGACKKQEAVA